MVAKKVYCVVISMHSVELLGTEILFVARRHWYLILYNTLNAPAAKQGVSLEVAGWLIVTAQTAIHVP